MKYPIMVLRKWKVFVPAFLITSFLLADILLGLNIIVRLEGQPWHSLPVGIFILALVVIIWLSTLGGIVARVNVYNDKLEKKGLFMSQKLDFKDIGGVDFHISTTGDAIYKLYIFSDQEGTEIWRMESAYLTNKKVRKDFFELLQKEINDLQLGSKIMDVIHRK